jgi:hypothetical protein
MAGFRAAFSSARPAPYVAQLSGKAVYIPRTEHGHSFVGSVVVLTEAGEVVSVEVAIDEDEGVYIESNVDLIFHRVRITS